MSISSYHIAESCANLVTQLAFTLANGFTIVEYYLARGALIDDFTPNLSCFSRTVWIRSTPWSASDRATTRPTKWAATIVAACREGSVYRAPLRELRFVLHELLGDTRLSQCPAFAEYDRSLADSVLEEAAKFAESVLAPINRSGDIEGAKWTPGGVHMPSAFKAAYEQFVASGWSQLRAAPEYGGQGAPLVLGTAVEEMWASANLAFKLCPMLTQGAVEAIERCGSMEIKRRFLPKMVSGEWTGTMNLTEPHAGSDLSAVRTRAVPHGDHYRLYGHKIFITYGDHDYTQNIIHLVLARVEGAPAGTKGISLFIAPKFLVGEAASSRRNDIRCVSIEHKLGIHASPTCVLSYGDREGATAYLVGEENRGLEYMFVMMNAARLSVGLEGYALAEVSYQRALDYARMRVQGRPVGESCKERKAGPIVHHADVKRMLLAMKARADAARALALYGAMQLDLARHDPHESVRVAAQARADLLIPIIKGWSTELGVTAASTGIQVHGGVGFVEETGAAQHLRDARICTIYEGTTGIQANDLVGRKVGRDGGVAMRALLAEMSAEIEATKQGEGTRRCADAAREAIDLLSSATDNVLRAHVQGEQYVQAVAVPYLMLCGVTIGSWLMLRAHAIAELKEREDLSFYAAKRQIARFYMDHVLPEAGALAQVVSRGGESVVEADPILF